MDMTVREASARLHLSGEKVRQLIKEHRLPNAYQLDPAKETSPYLIPEKDVRAFETARRFRKPLS